MTGNLTEFPPSIHDKLKSYVYRLIDPRDGETFYVGKGQGNRVFQHARGEFGPESEYAAGSKAQRISEIKASGHQVDHVIHRHGMSSHAATEVEAALIDAYPGLTNLQAGEGSRVRGVRSAKDVFLQYAAPCCKIQDPLILISVSHTWQERGVYDAVRGMWRVNIGRACRYTLVLARVQDLVVGVFEPEQWMRATSENFPFPEASPDFWCFVGCKARPELKERYLKKRLPPGTIKKGAMGGFFYKVPDSLDSAIIGWANIPYIDEA